MRTPDSLPTVKDDRRRKRRFRLARITEEGRKSMNHIEAIEVEVPTIQAVGRFGPLYKENKSPRGPQ
jgi:hypothetical protein